MNRKTWVEVAGWYGIVAILLAYFLVSFEFLSVTSAWYPVLNGTGALGMITVSFSKKAYQPAFVNVFWFLFAVAALVRAFV